MMSKCTLIHLIINKSILCINVLVMFIHISSSDEIDGRLLIRMKWSRHDDRQLNGIKKIIKLQSFLIAYSSSNELSFS